MADELDIKELCDRAAVTPRTVHFYIQQGLLPPAGATGPGARYSPGHLDRLWLIRLLQKEHLPLAEIGRRLRTLKDEDVRMLVEERQARGPAKESALDYVRGVLRGSENVERARYAGTAVTSALAAEPSAGSPLVRSQWDRIQLDDAMELHVRRPLTRQQQRRLHKVLAAARVIFEEPDL
jgi:DNA-binding transcriptional MerR regulator